jgi:serine/threonine protein phosphatase PrpC
MSRSIGDHELRKYGVVADPEFTEHEISKNDKILIIASDGVWDYLTNEDVMNI